MDFIISKLINDSIYTLYRTDKGYVLEHKAYPVSRQISVKLFNSQLLFSEKIDRKDFKKVIEMIKPKIKE